MCNSVKIDIMGLFWSKSKKNKSKSEEEGSGENTTNNVPLTLKIPTQKEFDEEFVKRLKLQFQNDMQGFILDMIVLSVAFFRNYDLEIKKYSHLDYKSDIEKDLNLALAKDNKQILMPDMIYRDVNRAVKFKPIHGRKKGKSEPLIPQRIYVTHEDIIVLDPEEGTSQQSESTSNIIVMPEYTKNVGYAKLRVRSEFDGVGRVSNDSSTNNSSTRTTEKDNDSEDISEEEASGEEESSGNENLEEENTFENSKNETSDVDKIELVENIDQNAIIESENGIREDSDNTKMILISEPVTQEETYTYARITNARNPKPIYLREDAPLKWIRSIKVKNLKLIEEHEEEEDIGAPKFQNKGEEKSDDEDDDLFVIHYYCDSEAFMKHFMTTVFPYSVGTTLNFHEDRIKNATFISGVIYCDTYDPFGGKVHCEIMPSIIAPWPSKLTISLNLRHDLNKWPLPGMMNDIIRHSKCVIISRGFMQKRGTNPECHLEWEWAFPEAEKYLQTRMSHAQIKSFLILVTIYKTFIEPLTNKNGLLIEHIRMLIFWECEKSFEDWQERMLGAKTIKLLQLLYKRLSRSRHYDFLIRDKNMFENIPGKFLRAAQEQINVILQAPVMNFIKALRNLSYSSKQNFYPQLNFKKLHEIVTTENSIQLVNPAIHKTIERDKKMILPKKKDMDPDQEWNYRLMRKQKMDEEKKKQKEQKQQKRKESKESINFEFEDFDNFEPIKKLNVLKFFIDHFIDMSKASLSFSTARQAKFYLKQAEYLTTLLEEFAAFGEIEDTYKEKIEKLMDKCDQRAATEVIEEPPSTPKRNFIFPPKEFMVNNTSINILNITRNFNSGAGPSSMKVKANGISKHVSVEAPLSNDATDKINGDKLAKKVQKLKKVASFKEEVEII